MFGIGLVVLFGNLFGGVIVLKYVFDYLDEVDGLIMMVFGGVEDCDIYFWMEGI